MVVKRLDASVKEHEVIARSPNIRSLTVVQLGVHVHVNVLITWQLLHQCSQAAKRGSFCSAVPVDDDNGTVLVLLVRMYD